MASYMLCIALFFVATANVAYGGLLDGGLLPGGLLGGSYNVSKISVSQLLVCSATGNVVPGVSSPGIAGVDVKIECEGGKLSLGTLTTDPNGFITGLLSAPQGIFFNPLTCTTTVQLPIGSCSLLPATGVLQSVLNLGGLVSTLIGVVGTLFGGAWQQIL